MADGVKRAYRQTKVEKTCSECKAVCRVPERQQTCSKACARVRMFRMLREARLAKTAGRERCPTCGHLLAKKPPA
jgi:hypothetical protein